MPTKTITSDELKAKLDAGDEFRLVMTLGEWAFEALHIPMSEHFPTIEIAIQSLAIDDEIVVYCSGPTCVASEFAYRGLVEHGYTNVRRYQGGLESWQAAGYPLEGSDAG